MLASERSERLLIGAIKTTCHCIRIGVAECMISSEWATMPLALSK